MNNYELFNFDNNNIESDISVLRNIEQFKKNNNLYNGISECKPIEELPVKLYRDDFMEQDIEIDIDADTFRKVWDKYKVSDGLKNKTIEIFNKEEKSIEKKVVSYQEQLDSFYSKAKELDNYLIKLKEERKELDEKKELLELTKKELEQEKELLNIEKEKFEEYKIIENDKLNKDKMRFQNLVEEMKNKIETILN